MRYVLCDVTSKMKGQELADQDKLRRTEKNWPQIVAVLVACLSSLTSGLFLAWPSPFILKITQDKENYAISEDQASYFTIFNVVGLIVFPPFLTIFNIPDIIGRKPTIMLTTIPHMISWILIAFCTDLYLLYLARFTSGVGDAIVFASVPVYIGEITTPKVRGMWGNGLICSAFLGQFLMNAIGAYCNVQETSFICLTVPVILVVALAFIPESPYFYVMKGKDEKAKKSLRKLRGIDDIEEELLLLKAAVERQMSEAGTWKDLVMVRSNRRALVALLFLRFSQVTSGIFVFASYTQFIFEKAGGKIESEVSSMIYMGLTFIIYSGGTYICDKFGRTKSYMISMALSGVVLLSESTFFYIDKYYPEFIIESITWFPLAGLIIFIIFSSFGIGTIPTLMLGELFSANIKSKGVSVISIVFGITVILLNYIFYFVNSYTGLFGPFLLFGCCNIVSAILTKFLVPETKGKSLEEIQLALKGMKTSLPS